MEINQEYLEAIKYRRSKLIFGIWESLLETNYLDKNEVGLSIPSINEIIEHYCTDYTVLKYRYKIGSRIERSKIAGLMVALFMRYKPIYIKTEEVKKTETIYSNEILAIIYGLSVCFDDSIEAAIKITQQPWFEKWFNDFRYLLHVRHHTSEALAFLFKTLMIFLKIDNEYCTEA